MAKLQARSYFSFSVALKGTSATWPASHFSLGLSASWLRERGCQYFSRNVWKRTPNQVQGKFFFSSRRACLASFLAKVICPMLKQTQTWENKKQKCKCGKSNLDKVLDITHWLFYFGMCTQGQRGARVSALSWSRAWLLYQPLVEP